MIFFALRLVLARLLHQFATAIMPQQIKELAMNLIASEAIQLVLPYVVADIASAAGSYDWAGAKTKAHAAVAGAIHSTLVDAALDKAIDAVLDAAAKVCQDQPDIQAALVALAKSDKGAAVKALETMVAKVLPPELASLLAA